MTFGLSNLVEIGSAYLFLIFGISLAINAPYWLEVIGSLKNNKASMISLGFWALSYGLLVVLTHNEWEWSPSVIITIFGWSALIKYIIYFVWPNLMWKMVDVAKNYNTAFLRYYGGLIALMMLWVISSHRSIL